MTKPPHVDPGRIDDAYAIAVEATERPVNEGRIVRAAETIEEALAEMKHFCEPANAANIGRLEALEYAWTNEFVFRNCVLAMSMICMVMATIMLMGSPWHLGIPHAMQVVGFTGFYPTLFGAIWLHSPRRNFGAFRAYEFRAAPILLTCGAALIAVGLLGTWLA